VAAAGDCSLANDDAGVTPVHSLAKYEDAHSGVTLATDGAGLRINAGLGAGSWDNYAGNVDNVTVMSDNYDFEAPLPACTTDCYVRTDGNDANSGSADTASDAKLTIQAAVNQVSSGGTVHVAAGTYAENVTVSTPLTLTGVGEGSTFIEPAVSNPVCGGGSLCGGTASNIILVQPDNVTIHDITLAGDNASLT